MSIKVRSLGTVAAAVRGIVFSDITNASPGVATVTAGHRMKNGDRIGVSGVTGNTSMNGDWEVASVGATSATLVGSSGIATTAGTIIVGVLCDRTPFLPRHSAMVQYGDQGGVANSNFVGTVVFEGADKLDLTVSPTAFYYDNSSGVATAGWKSALQSGEIAIPAQVTAGGGTLGLEVSLSRYMVFRCSSYTGGNAACWMAA